MGKTVTTYLIDGDPKGTQYAFISNKICQMFVVPRSNLSYLNTQEKLQKPAFYILLGEDESTKPQAYIGETENFKERVKDHDSKKSFWQKALIFVSKDAYMTKVDVQYLEHKAIAEAKKTNAFVLSDNKQIPKAPNLPEHQQDAMDEFFEDVKFLASSASPFLRMDAMPTETASGSASSRSRLSSRAAFSGMHSRTPSVAESLSR